MNTSIDPPWKAFPDLPRLSGARFIGGAPEAHLQAWTSWFDGLSQNARLDYFREHQPIPAEWADWAGMQVFPELDAVDPEHAVARLHALGMTDLDAWRLWMDAL
ncbi:MAG: hypothetical protein AAFV53_17785 [Myxococcota bacterium]